MRDRPAFSFPSFPATGIAVIPIVAHQLLTPVGDMGAQDGEQFQSVEDPPILTERRDGGCGGFPQPEMYITAPATIITTPTSIGM